MQKIKSLLKNISVSSVAAIIWVTGTAKLLPKAFVVLLGYYIMSFIAVSIGACFVYYFAKVQRGEYYVSWTELLKVFLVSLALLLGCSYIINLTVNNETIKEIAQVLVYWATVLSPQYILVESDMGFLGNSTVPPSPTAHCMDGQPGSSSNTGNPGGGSNIAGSSSNPGGSSSIAGSYFNPGDFGNSGSAGKFGKHVKTVITPIGTFLMDEHGKLLDEYGRVIHRKGLEDYVSHEVAHYEKDIEKTYSENDLFKSKLYYIKGRAEKQSSIIRKIINRTLTDETRVEIARIQDSYRDSIREAEDCANSSRFDHTDYHRKASSLEALQWVQRQKEVQVLLRDPLISERDRVRITRMIRQIPCLKSDNFIARMYASSFESEIQKQRLNDKWEKLDKLYLFSELKHKGSPDDYIVRKRR